MAVSSARDGSGEVKATAQLRQGDTVLQLSPEFVGTDKAEVLKQAKLAIKKALETGTALDAEEKTAPVTKPKAARSNDSR